MGSLLIVNADDFGISEGVNRGILEAYERGILTSTTAMVNMPAFDQAAHLAAENPGLGVGIHLNLSAGVPVLPPSRIPHLVGQGGRFLRIDGLLARLATGRVDLGQVEAEMNAQVKRALEAGLSPTHLDSHHHLHLYPSLHPVVVRVALRHGIRGVRSTAEMSRPEMARRIGMLARLGSTGRESSQATYLKTVILSALGISLRRRIRGAGLVATDRFRGLALGVAFSPERLKRDLEGLAEGSTELMCHPGYPDEQLRRVTSYSDGRDSELEALLSPAVAEVLKARGVRLGSYSALSR